MELSKLFNKLIDTMDVLKILIMSLFFLMVGHRPLWWSRKKLNKSSNSVYDIPGPIALPIFGTRWLFSWIGGYPLNKLHECHRDLFQKYGPIMKEEALWNIPVINIVERKDIEKVLRADGKYPIRPPIEALAYYRESRPDRYSSKGLVNEQGEIWHHLRTNLVKELLSPQTISSFLPAVKEMSRDFCELIRHTRSEDNKIGQLEMLSRRLGLEVTCTLVLGRRMGFLLPTPETELAKRLNTAVRDHFLSCRDTYFGLPFWKLFTTKTYSKLIENENDVYNLVLELISNADVSAQESVILESILHANIDDREKTAAVIDFIIAGIDTLANSLVFILSLVKNRKDLQEKIAKDEQNHDYIRACLKESFRLLPAANCLARIIDKDLELSGHLVKAGNVVVCQTGLACRDPKYFVNPDEFLPERWLDNQKETLANSMFIFQPFGYGRRTCPGKRFVEQSLPIILEELVKDFVIDGDELEILHEFIMAPKGPVEMTFKDRY